MRPSPEAEEKGETPKGGEKSRGSSRIARSGAYQAAEKNLTGERRSKTRRGHFGNASYSCQSSENQNKRGWRGGNRYRGVNNSANRSDCCVEKHERKAEAHSDGEKVKEKPQNRNDGPRQSLDEGEGGCHFCALAVPQTSLLGKRRKRHQQEQKVSFLYSPLVDFIYFVRVGEPRVRGGREHRPTLF